MSTILARRRNECEMGVAGKEAEMAQSATARSGELVYNEYKTGYGIKFHWALESSLCRKSISVGLQ